MLLDQLRLFIGRVAPLPLCEDCVAERIADSTPEAVHLALNELVVERGFDRLRAVCSLCGGEHLTVQKMK